MQITPMKTIRVVALALGVAVAFPVLTYARSANSLFPKNAALIGHVVYADGRPAAGVQIVAQIQDAAEMKLIQKLPQSAWNSIFARIDEADTVTQPNGSYRLVVASHLPYNIMVNLAKPPREDDRNVPWVAAAKEGVVGKADQMTTLSNFVLTRGVLVTGRVIDNSSKQTLSGIHVGNVGPSRPASTAMVIDTVTNKSGQYRLRVMPGNNLVYIADSRYNGFSDIKARALGLMKTVAVTKGKLARADFRVSLNQKP